MLSCLALLFCFAAGLNAADSLQATFARMDAAAGDFKGMTASLRMDSFISVINEHDVSSGTIAIKRGKPKEMKMLVAFTEPDPKMVGLQGRKLEMYFPKINTVQEYDVGKSSTLLEQFFLVGFGTTSRDMQAAYSIKWLGSETVGGANTGHLELVPKAKEVLQHMLKLELWIADLGNPAQQKFYFPGNEYKLITYKNLKTGDVKDDQVNLKSRMPAGVKREKPQK